MGLDDATGRKFVALSTLSWTEGAQSQAHGAGDGDGGPGQNRTGDTRIFSAVLYQLSYRATGRAILGDGPGGV